MSNIDWKILDKQGVSIKDLYEGAFLIKMKAEELLREGKNADELYESEYRIISSLSQMGDPSAMILLGEMLQGRKVKSLSVNDPTIKAMELWREAAEKGEARGYTNIGLLYLHKPIPGGGEDHTNVEYDPEKALSYFLKAYELGDSKAGRHIGICYKDGIGTKTDPEKAYEWFCKAADRNDSTARYLKAECIYYGKGVEEDKEKALKLMKELACQSAHDSQKAAQFIETHLI